MMNASGVPVHIYLSITWRAAGSFQLMEHPQGRLTACKATCAGLYSSWVMMTLTWIQLLSGWRVRSRETDWHPRVIRTLNTGTIPLSVVPCLHAEQITTCLAPGVRLKSCWHLVDFRKSGAHH